jgi:hypothetical protein
MSVTLQKFTYSYCILLAIEKATDKNVHPIRNYKKTGSKNIDFFLGVDNLTFMS